MELLGEPHSLEGGVVVQNCRFHCTDGIRLTGQRWTVAASTTSETTTTSASLRILCWHGYMDNCRSFAALAPRLVRDLGSRNSSNSNSNISRTTTTTPVELIAMDFPGHGQSSHKSRDHPPFSLISDLVVYMAQVAQLLQWQTFHLMGHSMGAIVSVMYAGTFPEQISQLILLDGFGPDFERPDRVVGRLKQHLETRYAMNAVRNNNSSIPTTTTTPIANRKQGGGRHDSDSSAAMDAFSSLSAPAAAAASSSTLSSASSSNHPPATAKSKTKRIYRTIEDAIRTRQQTAIKSPGDQWISYEATKEMVEWALEPATATTTTIMNGDDDGGWTFRHDPRLHWPALQAHTLEQAFDFWKSLQTGKVPTLWLRAEHGWPYSTKWLDRAEAYLGENLITIRTLEGSHHFHADPETVDAVAATILEHFIVPSPSNT